MHVAAVARGVKWAARATGASLGPRRVTRATTRHEAHLLQLCELLAWQRKRAVDDRRRLEPRRARKLLELLPL
eukprot:1730848-Prymnesium_polylepis.1